MSADEKQLLPNVVLLERRDVPFTPAQTAIDAMKWSDRLEMLAWVGIDRQGRFVVAWSNGSSTDVYASAGVLSDAALQALIEG